MASNIKYPENSSRWFVQGSNLALLTDVDSDGDTRTTTRKKWQAIDEAVTDGILIHYYGEPNSLSSITSSIDLDNSLHLAIVDYVKKCLYMDKAGVSAEPNIAALSAQMSSAHKANFDEAVVRYGMRKRDKTGGARVLKPVNLL